MKKHYLFIIMILCALVFTGCGSAENDTKEECLNVEESSNTVARFSGSFTATVEGVIPDYNALPENTIAIVHYFQDYPFLLRFNEDMTGKFTEGETYVFDFETFEVNIPEGEDDIDISDYMYSIIVTSFRPAEDGEMGLSSITATVEIIKQ